ncbi:MAG: type II toxin-antitoxin system ParD family antitoxin [Symploca sp. SIO1B1]|nr:type II toxin-antitoxin system ParD family antitoxin [Symploca sp. SIO1A3]NER98754.1 type II toxin-antitoxin system ParD family antitoxin [Symploca sp. SIO1B1]
MITLTSAQEQIVEDKLTTGNYTSAEEVIDLALELLKFLDAESLAWLKQTQQKILIGIEELDRKEGVDGAMVMDQMLQRFQDARQGKHR